ncbi:MAG: hypothetical protein OXB88_02365 [Bacteriovoracales bacterium]|nr:hypothetical protein [Bacteriovoracales bacterium]
MKFCMKNHFFLTILTATFFISGCQVKDLFYKKVYLEASDMEVSEDQEPIEVPYALSSPTEEPIVFRWYTEDGTASSGEDYEFAYGVVTIAPGETVGPGIINITIKNDNVREGSEYFKVRFVPEIPEDTEREGEEIEGKNMEKEIRIVISDDDKTPSSPPTPTPNPEPTPHPDPTPDPDPTPNPPNNDIDDVDQIQTDTFEQSNVQRSANILWIVDDSGSMKNDQRALGDNFSSFINTFVNSAQGNNLEFKMGIATTDPAQMTRTWYNADGLTHERLAEDRSEFINLFKNEIRVGTRGSNRERAFSASYKFLEANPRWLRSSAANNANSILSIIYVSDEKEQSGNSVEYWIDKLKKIKGDNLVRLYSISCILNDPVTGQPVTSPCKRPFSRKGLEAPRFIEASGATGGTTQSIRNDFGANLQALSQSIYESMNSFILSKIFKSSGSIEVRVNGRIVEEGVDWTYDSESNSIKFLPGKTPNRRATIEVEYNY